MKVKNKKKIPRKNKKTGLRNFCVATCMHVQQAAEKFSTQLGNYF